MNKEEVFNILYGKETWDIFKKFQEIENSIDNSDYLYQYFDEIKAMLKSDKSAIRVRGFRIICKLAKYDKENKINHSIDLILDELDDLKPTVVRQCLNSLNAIILYKPNLANKIQNKLKLINYSKYKDSMSPLIKKDVDELLKNI